MRLSTQRFPPYTYVPGKTPHPRSDPKGHSFNRPEPHIDSFDINKWRSSDAYLFGIDLFNAGYHWESHEQWEAIWHAVGRTGVVADFFKGLIKLAAAKVKRAEGNFSGMQRHSRRAMELFQNVNASHETMAGLRINELLSNATQLSDEKTCEFEFTLRPQVQP